jgi:hypothetical protein
MKIYSVILSVDYEGEDLLGVFGSREDAVEFIKSQESYQKKWYGDYGVVESELGQPIDTHGMVDWVE